MALLTLQLADLEAFSLAAVPLIPEGDPNAGEPDTNHPDHDSIVAMRNFRRKIRSTIIYFARQLGAGATFVIAGRPNFPSPVHPQPGSSEPQEAAGWSQQVLASPDSKLDAAFRIALYNDIDAPLASPAFVFALGVSPSTSQIDTGLRNAMIPLLPLLTKGHAPGR